MAGAQAEARFENIVAPGIDSGEILSGEIFLRPHRRRPNAIACGSEEFFYFFTTANDLLNVPSEDFLCSSPQLAFETAGTSGRNKKLFYNYEEFENAARRASIALVFLWSATGRPDFKCLRLLLLVPGYFLARVLPYTGAFSVTVGKIEPLEVYRRMESYGFTVMLGEPTWMVQLTELAEAQGRAYPLKLIIGSGEMLTERARTWIEKDLAGHIPYGLRQRGRWNCHWSGVPRKTGVSRQ